MAVTTEFPSTIVVGRRKVWPAVLAAAALAVFVSAGDAIGEAEKKNRDVPNVGALADRAEVEARFKTGVEAYDRGDYAGAFDAWLELAQTGDPAAQRNIGHMYRNGLGVRQDFAVAGQWYRRAADSGLARAQANLAMMHLRGQGMGVDPKQAAYWFQAAAQQGHVIAQYNLGLMHLRGLGVTKSEEKAIAWLYRASKSGHEKSMATLSQIVADNPKRDKAAPKTVTLEDLQKSNEDDDEAAAKTVTVEELQQDDDQGSDQENSKPAGRTSVTTAANSGKFAKPRDQHQGSTAKPVTVTRIDTSGLPPASTDPKIDKANSPAPNADAARAVRGELQKHGIPQEMAMAAAAVASNKGAYGVAMSRLKPLAEADNAEAQYQLAHLHLKRANRDGDPAYGYFWLARAELSGHPKALVERTRLDMALERDVLFKGRRILQTWRRQSQ